MYLLTGFCCWAAAFVPNREVLAVFVPNPPNPVEEVAVGAPNGDLVWF